MKYNLLQLQVLTDVQLQVLNTMVEDFKFNTSTTMPNTFFEYEYK